MTMTTTPNRSRSDLGERNQRRVNAAASAAASGGMASLAMALLGPSSPPSGPPPALAPVEEPAVGTPLYECRTGALGLRTYVGLVGPYPSILDEARQRLADLERRWSVDGKGSEIARLRANRGVALPVSSDTLLLTGLLNSPKPVPDAQRRSGVWVDARHGTAGVVTDGPWDVTAMAAALTADLVVTDMIEAGALGACVRIGTAMRAEGISPRRSGWLTTAPPTRVGTPGTVLRLRQGAMVTGRRAGRDGDRPVAVAVIADHAWRAQALVTAALEAPTARARALVAGAATAGCILTPDGRAMTVGRWADFEVR